MKNTSPENPLLATRGSSPARNSKDAYFPGYDLLESLEGVNVQETDSRFDALQTIDIQVATPDAREPEAFECLKRWIIEGIISFSGLDTRRRDYPFIILGTHHLPTHFLTKANL